MMKFKRNFTSVADDEKDHDLLVGARLDSTMISDDHEVKDLMARFPTTPLDIDRLAEERMACLEKGDYFIANPDKTVVVMWSGGLDSTGVLTNLLKQGYDVQPVYLASRHGSYLMRELYSMTSLWHAIKDLNLPGYLYPPMFKDMLPIMDAYRQSADLIPNRNELFVQYAATAVCNKYGISMLGTGEYTGAEHWVVGWHVPVEDCEISSFTGWFNNYLKPELRAKSRLWTLDDFGPAHVKSRRLKIGINAVGNEVMTKTTCCLSDTIMECGTCYCCVERAAAFFMLGEKDNTKYLVDPKSSWLWPYYMSQMAQFPA